MTIVLDEPWEVALFVIFCAAGAVLIARNLWLSVRPDPRNEKPET